MVRFFLHTDGQVPNLKVTIPAQDEKSLGRVILYVRFACGVSGYILGVNPFNQPGVRATRRTCSHFLENQDTKKKEKNFLRDYKNGNDMRKIKSVCDSDYYGFHMPGHKRKMHMSWDANLIL